MPYVCVLIESAQHRLPHAIAEKLHLTRHQSFSGCGTLSLSVKCTHPDVGIKADTIFTVIHLAFTTTSWLPVSRSHEATCGPHLSSSSKCMRFCAFSFPRTRTPESRWTQVVPTSLPPNSCIPWWHPNNLCGRDGPLCEHDARKWSIRLDTSVVG